MSSQQKYYKTKNILLVISFVGIVILAFLLLRSCGNEKATLAYERIEDSLRTTIDKKDSILNVAVTLQRGLADAEGQKRWAIEQMNQYRELADKSSIRAETLARQVKNAKVIHDTIGYIIACDSLADENIYLRQVVVHNDSLITNILSLTDRRIKKSDSLAEHWRMAYSDCIRVSEFVSNELPEIKPKGRVYFDLTGMTGAITAVGFGFGYMDKNGRIINADWLISAHGNIYQLRLATPLNFGRK